MRDYSIDLDLMKEVMWCKGVTRVDWRVSSSGRGWHIAWTCSKRYCKACAVLEKKFDDPKRYKHDFGGSRPRHHRRILWDNKGGRKAGAWKSITKGVPS